LIRDEELSRLIKYAQGMGLTVRFKDYVRGGFAAEWALDGTEITLYTSSTDSKIDTILGLIHELGHHKAFVDNKRTVDPKLEEALDSEESKRHRKRILDMEIEDSAYWEEIYRDTNCKFNIEKLHKQREFDIWCYEVSYEMGRNATVKEKRIKLRELRKKYRC
jgi:hypothetical protein